MMRIGGSWPDAQGPTGFSLVFCITRTWIGLVWVRSSLRSPSGPGAKKKVSCISRAGWRGGKFRPVKLWKSSSMSGPSATAKPRVAKMAIISSITCMVGWTAPRRTWGAGRVRSRRSAARRRSSSAVSSAARRSLRAVCTRSRRPLIWPPRSRRSSGLRLPRVFSRAETAPCLPTAATRTASRADRSAAAATCASRSASSVTRSVMVRSSNPSPLAERERAAGPVPTADSRGGVKDARRSGTRHRVPPRVAGSLQARAARTLSAMALNAAGSAPATSASTLRSMSIPATSRPWINCE